MGGAKSSTKKGASRRTMQKTKAPFAGLPDEEGRSVLQSYAANLRDNPENQALFVKIHEARYWEPKRNGGQRRVTSVAREAAGPYLLLKHLGRRPVKRIRAADFQDWQLDTSVRQRLTAPERGGACGDRTTTEYQDDAKRFLTRALGKAKAVAVCVIVKNPTTGPDRSEGAVPWTELYKVRKRLKGMNLVLFILLAATAMTVEDVRQVRANDVSFDGKVALITTRPTPREPMGRTVGLLFGDRILKNYVSRRRENGAGDQPLFPRKRHPDQGLLAIDIRIRVQQWGNWIGRPDLTPDDLSVTAACYFLARDDGGEDYVMHVRGTRDSTWTTTLKRHVMAAKLRGVTFGAPTGFESPAVGNKSCPECGHNGNDVDAKRCSECGESLIEGDDEAVETIAELQRVIARLRSITGETPDERADKALEFGRRRRRR